MAVWCAWVRGPSGDRRLHCISTILFFILKMLGYVPSRSTSVAEGSLTFLFNILPLDEREDPLVELTQGLRCLFPMDVIFKSLNIFELNLLVCRLGSFLLSREECEILKFLLLSGNWFAKWFSKVWPACVLWWWLHLLSWLQWKVLIGINNGLAFVDLVLKVLDWKLMLGGLHLVLLHFYCFVLLTHWLII